MNRKQKIIADFFKKWEGGYVNHPNDKGGPTNMGVTIGTFRLHFGLDKTVDDLKNMTEEQWFEIFKKGFYDKCKADDIEDEYIALLVCDFCWMSGVKNSIKQIQKCLGCSQIDGIVGPVTLYKLNNFPDCFNKLWEMRKQYYIKLVDVNPDLEVFYKGWMNRLRDLKKLKENSQK